MSWGKEEVQGQANWAPQQACSTPKKLAKLNFCGKPCCICQTPWNEGNGEGTLKGKHPWAHLIQKAPIPLVLLQTWIVVEFLPCLGFRVSLPYYPQTLNPYIPLLFCVWKEGSVKSVLVCSWLKASFLKGKTQGLGHSQNKGSQRKPYGLGTCISKPP